MNEIVEMIYQWQQGDNIKGIRLSLGFDRKTIRKYVGLAQKVGVCREESFPEESDLVEKLKALSDSALLRETPEQGLIAPYRHLIEKWLSGQTDYGQADLASFQGGDRPFG